LTCAGVNTPDWINPITVASDNNIRRQISETPIIFAIPASKK